MFGDAADVLPTAVPLNGMVGTNAVLVMVSLVSRLRGRMDEEILQKGYACGLRTALYESSDAGVIVTSLHYLKGAQINLNPKLI